MKNNIIYHDFGNERYNKLQEKRKQLEHVLETVNLSNKDQKRVRDHIEKLFNGIDVPKLDLTRFTK